MINVKLMGGLGNQMFQFCAGLNLSKRLNTQFTIDDSILISNLTNEHSVKRDLDLEIFKIHSHPFYNGKVREKINSITRNFNRILPVNLRSYYIEKNFNYNNNILLLNNNTTIEGYWQSYKYFYGIENEIQESFKFQNELLEQSKSIHKEITNCQSVCINVRRADFAVNSFHGTLEIEYYINAIDLIKSKVNSEVHFFIFSDDIDWCKNNFNFLFNKTIVDHNHKGLKFSNYLYLMMCCKHFIIPNSSFAWWAAWLSKNTRKIIIAPKIWFKGDAENLTLDLIPTNWIRI